MSQTPDACAPTARVRAIEIGVLILALVVRLLWFDLMEFKFDEVDVLQLTREWVLRGGLPQYGMMSGVGVRNPPGFIFLLWPWVAAQASPLAIGGFIAVLNVLAVWLMLRLGRALGQPAAGRWAAAFMAVHPWLILYSRKIWAQSVLPVFMLLALIIMAIGTAHPRHRATFWLLPVLALAWQIHFSAWCLVAVALLWLTSTALRGRLNLRWALAGGLPALLVLGPYLHHLTATACADLRAQAHVGGGGGIAQAGSVLRSWVQTAFAGGFGQIGAAGPASLASVMPGAAGSLLELLAWTGTVAVLALASHSARRDASHHPDFRLWLALAALMPPALYAARGIVAPPHYFIIGLPALLFLAGLGAGRLRVPRAASLAPWLPGALVVTCGVVVWLAVIAHIRHTGGTGGDYGVAYRHQRTAADMLAKGGVPADGVDATLMRDDGVGVLYLLNRLLPETAGHVNGKSKLLDTLRHPDLARARFPAGWREERAGPLRIGVAPGE
ncbi:MAG: glycosyltransferase family 39 protein [Lentisphaerae bacterium]|nr:glycosyltransferase family 39 protein [Lentisphaerota bacterium]